MGYTSAPSANFAIRTELSRPPLANTEIFSTLAVFILSLCVILERSEESRSFSTIQHQMRGSSCCSVSFTCCFRIRDSSLRSRMTQKSDCAQNDKEELCLVRGFFSQRLSERVWAH